MKMSFTAIFVLLLVTLLAGCGAGEESADMSLFGSAKIVGKDVQTSDITDFYYTEENINYDAFYQRYRFYVEDGKHMFFHETRERRNDYGPCTEDDATLIGTIELTDEQWSEFTGLVSGGTVKAREDSADSGGSGPWLYLYWTDDKGKYQQFSFDSYGTQTKFEEFCRDLAAKAGDDNSVEDSGVGFGDEASVGDSEVVHGDEASVEDSEVGFGDDVSAEDPHADQTANIKAGSPEDYITNDNLLFDYYEATVATVGGNDREEYCLYKYTDTRLVLARYSKTEGSEETMVYCTVPSSVLDDCMDLVDKYNMRNWKDGSGLNGKKYVVKFMDGGELKRVSSENMPENGREAFIAIGGLLSSCYGR